ncbi:hypothetical protein NFK10_08885 [Citrobacter braakii]|uniref:hypothetical protein n=1 Tax=Citrobacter braakii TaxID=57706 RepID=UPI0020C7E6A0|nr:hypothetical protein [Citrobacter braakii]WFX69104.1 hypothetical protein NFK10_08885 [Citrobacter braakii]
MTATNKPMTGAQLDELMAVAMRMQYDSEKMGERSVSMFAYAVQVAVLEIRETRCKYAELQSQNADMAVQLANAESKCRELAAELSAVNKIHNEAVFITDDHYEQCPSEVQKMIRSLAVLQIPAYADLRAEVRAQGVEMFAQWCRGESDFTLIDEDMSDAAAYEECVKRAEYFAAQLRKGSAL